MNLMIESKLIPSKIICPYSYILLTDAVSTSDGYIFSRKAIETWFEKGQKCNPITHLILPNLQLSEMLQIQKQAKEYEQKEQGLEESLLLLKKQGENQIHFRQQLFEFKKNWRKFRESFQKFENQLEIEISTFPSIQLSENMYKGEMKKGYPDGYGLMDYKTGERYLGEWKHGKQEGRGKKFVPHENFYYFGEWKHGVLNGFGCIRPKGDKSLILFKGNFVDGEKNGLGIYEDEEKKEKYEGYWKEDKKNGKGVEFYENGDFFQGTWVNDCKTGLGVLKKTTELGFFIQEWFNDEKEVEVPIMSTISESDKCCQFNPCPFF